MKNSTLDAIDKKILDIIQTDFPLVSRPYLKIGESLDITEEEAFDRVCKMRESGIIRRLGANFQSSSLNHVSTLCAARVPAGKMKSFIEKVNALEGVTHNYERDHEWNVWFTLISPSREERRDILAGLIRETGVEIMDLPATRLFKIKIDFPMGDSRK